MTAGSLRARLAAGTAVGAGNVLTTLMERGEGLDREVDSVDIGSGGRLFTAACEEAILAACPDVLLQLEAGADTGADRTAAVLAVLDPQAAATVRSVSAVDEENVPLTPTGKVRKAVLRERRLAGARR
ncbi:MAG TPA: hypothetical protein VGG25_14040 [Streptosporangiaceae bacterium]|jgi:hypothetical protein